MENKKYMKPVYIKPIFAAIILVFALEGCAKPPVAEMDSAVEAVTRAENNADAVLYASGILVRARDALNRMRAEADSKRYDAAKALAAEAVSAADRAIAEGKAGAARARDEAAALVASLEPDIAETNQGIRAAQAAKLPLDFNALGQNFDAARLSADQAEIALAGGQYQEALDKCRNAQAGLSDINRKLSEAALAVNRKK
jgi:hypothetical protein